MGGPLGSQGAFAWEDSLAPGATGSFSVEIYGDDGCPRFGWSKRIRLVRD